MEEIQTKIEGQQILVEDLEISKTMYDDFFKFFETINSLLCIHENKIINKEEN